MRFVVWGMTVVFCTAGTAGAGYAGWVGLGAVDPAAQAASLRNESAHGGRVIVGRGLHDGK